MPDGTDESAPILGPTILPVRGEVTADAADASEDDASEDDDEEDDDEEDEEGKVCHSHSPGTVITDPSTRLSSTKTGLLTSRSRPPHTHLTPHPSWSSALTVLPIAAG